MIGKAGFNFTTLYHNDGLILHLTSRHSCLLANRTITIGEIASVKELCKEKEEGQSPLLF